MTALRLLRAGCLILGCLTVVASSSCAGPLQSASSGRELSDENHRRAAEEYLALLDQEALAESYVTVYLEELGEQPGSLDEEERALLESRMIEIMRSEDVRRHLVELYLVRFTQSELEELADFYRTPTGRKLLDEAPQVMDASARIAAGALAAATPREETAAPSPSSDPPSGQKEIHRARRLDEDGVPLAPSNVAAPPQDASCTSSGLCYLFLRKLATEGPLPDDDSRVTVHYTGWTRDGSMFDSSVARGRPATFGVSQVIKGWTEALQLMPEGSILRVWIPPELAYGETPRRPGAPAGQLTFDIQLLEIEEN